MLQPKLKNHYFQCVVMLIENDSTEGSHIMIAPTLQVDGNKHVIISVLKSFLLFSRRNDWSTEEERA